MHSQIGTLDPGEIGVLLRGESEPISSWAGRWSWHRTALHIGVIILGAGLYGAAMGWWRDPRQGLFTAIKFPLIILLTTAGNTLLNAMLASLLGLNIRLAQAESFFQDQNMAGFPLVSEPSLYKTMVCADFLPRVRFLEKIVKKLILLLNS